MAADQRPQDESSEADAVIDELLPAAVAGDSEAQSNLWKALEPRISALVRRPRVSGRLCSSEDDCRNIVVEVMSRLFSDDQRRLRLFLESQASKPGLTFIPWLIVVTKRVAVDYLRGHGDYIDRRRSRNEGSAPGRWVEMRSMPAESRIGGGRPPVTNRSAAMKMLRYAYKELPAEQLAALELWIVNSNFRDIAAELKLADAADAQKLVRAALERLRRRFRESAVI